MVRYALGMYISPPKILDLLHRTVGLGPFTSTVLGVYRSQSRVTG